MYFIPLEFNSTPKLLHIIIKIIDLNSGIHVLIISNIAGDPKYRYLAIENIPKASAILLVYDIT